MKSLKRASVLFLSVALGTAILCGLPGYGQDGPPTGGGTRQDGQDGVGGGQGMAAFAEHGVQGTVTAIAGDNITVKTEDGAAYRIETGVNTRFRKQRDPIKLTDIHVGDMVGAFGDKDDKAKTIGAIAVMVFDKEQFERARAEFGKTWTAGAVQSINETKITIKRPDNATQVVVVDENTSFRKHRESVTLADIKLGDNISARGSLVGASFVAATLAIGGPGGGPGGGGFRGQHPVGSSAAGNGQPATPAAANAAAPPNP